MRKSVALSVLIAFLLLTSATAYADQPPENDSFEAKAMQAFLNDCVPPVTAGSSVSHAAQKQHLPELPSGAEYGFLNGKSGRVFGLPDVGPGIVLAAPDGLGCSLLIEQLDAKNFMHQANYWFDAKRSPFKLTEDSSIGGELHRQYTANIGDKTVLLFMSLRPEATGVGIQAMLTCARTK